MKKRNKFGVVCSAAVLILCAALFLGQRVNAAGESKITGTVKLDGTAPHMKGIDMSKDPYCVKAHANDTPSPRNRRRWRERRTAECGSLYLRRPDWQCADRCANGSASIQSKELYVYAARDGAGRQPEIQCG